jgi:hypothetical protein
MSLIHILKNRDPGQIPDEHRKELQKERCKDFRFPVG